MGFEELIEAWDGEEVVVHRDESTSSWMLIGVHDTTLGPAMGGTRLTSYEDPSDALEDVLRLAEAMTWKQAAAELPYGGGKAVIAVPSVPAPGSEDRRDLLFRYAELVEDDALEGRSVLVQGLGSVGSRLAGHLHDAGASLLLADVDAERATTLADELGAKVVRADDVIGTESDVFAPCATGAF